MPQDREQPWADRLAGLPGPSRRLLLLLALDGTGDLRSLYAVAAAQEWRDGLAPAQRARLVLVDEASGRAAFGHPVVGAEVVRLATPAQRRQGHAVLARLPLDQGGGEAAYREGRWDEAEAAARAEAEQGEPGPRLRALGRLALLAAATGDAAGLEVLVKRLADAPPVPGVPLPRDLADRALVLAALGRGDPDEAFRRAGAIGAPDRLDPGAEVALEVAADLVEAALRSGRPREAAAHAAALRRLPAPPGPELLLAVALVASGPEVPGRYRAALEAAAALGAPFPLARVRLAYGEHLRRARSGRAAREQLLAAHTAFERLGARPFAERARRELRAAEPDERRAGPGELTAQEREVASLAAAGLSNKQIGGRLYLSPRTVSGHLYRAFPKLGVSSRAALRDALTARADLPRQREEPRRAPPPPLPPSR